MIEPASAFKWAVSIQLAALSLLQAPNKKRASRALTDQHSGSPPRLQKPKNSIRCPPNYSNHRQPCQQSNTISQKNLKITQILAGQVLTSTTRDKTSVCSGSGEKNILYPEAARLRLLHPVWDVPFL
jgi:hypothetical protein